ncbi:RNA polymerase sigma factor [Actinoplanes palleronii]|uniref:RNA polymerase sigma factor n=1 Tax=Actinoplanes palleronii TaxID=113570 RepID=A0ABQ4BSW4_9ACTN|nr:sigma-70 family RNA polymerase sigma factor [Actinoplanes palleronii]GIE73779.1 RNA polymerase sigma factor [Actinoplanes palleronii]
MHRPQADDPPWGDDAGRVRAVLSMGGVPWQDLDDAVQQVRLKLLEQSPATPIANPAAWTAVVASRVAVDWHRGRQRLERLRQRLVALRAPGVAETMPDRDRDLALVVAGELDELSPDQRQLLVLRFYTDLTVPQIAGVLGVAPGTVKSRLHVAVGQMRARLGAKGVV